MLVQFAQQVFDTRHLSLLPHKIMLGDIIVLNNTKFRVETIQRNCPSIENLGHMFTHWILRDENNAMVRSRGIYGRQEIYRKRSTV